MNRLEFLKRAALIAAGVVAADQIELLERLAPRRLYFRGADFARPWEPRHGFMITREMVEDDMYGDMAKHLLKKGFARHYQLETDSYILRKIRNSPSTILL